MIVGYETERHDVAIETTHTLERLSNSVDNKKIHDPKLNKSDKTAARDDDNRTPEEGICLEFEEFNPEVSEKEKRERRLSESTDMKKDFRQTFSSNRINNNKEINFYDNQSGAVFNHQEAKSDVILMKEDSHAIYSKPDKKKKTNKIDITKTNQIKGLNTKYKENSSTKSKHITPSSINDVTFDELPEKKISLAEKIGLFESNKDQAVVRGHYTGNEIKNNSSRALKSNHKKCEIPEETVRDKSKIIAPPTNNNRNHNEGSKSVSTNKSGKERDRGVEVYMETVRQRSTVKDKKQLTADLFKRQTATKMSNNSIDSLSDHEEDTREENVGLPSVRKLLARFENGDQDESVVKNGISKASSQTRKVTPSKKPSFSEARKSNPAAVSSSFRNLERNIHNQREHHSDDNLEDADDNSDSDDDIQAETVNKHWDPQYFVRCLYKIPDIGESEDDGFISLDANQSCPSIEGYMDRLPAGRKKSTMSNSWKKQYFVAKNGILFVYENKCQEDVMDKFELFGGRVDFMDSSMLGLQDRRGQYLVVRCSSHRAAQEWESALSFHTQEDYSNTFVCPAPLPRNIRMLTNVIVIDLGGSSVRAGVAGQQQYLPRVFFPSIMAVHPGNVHEKYFGFEALRPEVRATCQLSYPLLPSKKVDKYSVDLVALCGLLLRVFKDLQVDPKKYELQLSVPRNFNDKTKAAIASLLFDEFEVESVNMGHQTVFALHSYRTDTGVVVDIGERMDVVPIVSGYKVQSGISRTTTGGGNLVNNMKHALLGHNYSLTSDLDSYVVKHVIEKLCYVSRNYDAELEKLRQDPKFADKSVLIDQEVTSRITIGVDRFETAEGIFKPELWGLDQAGIHVLVKKAIAECSLDARKEVTRSIFLSGGTTMIPGFNHRLETELEKLLPARPKVHASPYRYHAAFLGASYHAVTEDFNKMKLRRKDWVSGQAKNTASLWIL